MRRRIKFGPHFHINHIDINVDLDGMIYLWNPVPWTLKCDVLTPRLNVFNILCLATENEVERRKEIPFPFHDSPLNSLHEPNIFVVANFPFGLFNNSCRRQEDSRAVRWLLTSSHGGQSSLNWFTVSKKRNGAKLCRILSLLLIGDSDFGEFPRICINKDTHTHFALSRRKKFKRIFPSYNTVTLNIKCDWRRIIRHH